ncbi:MAG: family NAD(P)-dependent oxidoreductase [Nocardioidaceae bacterium]|nr:family NAD(P)-dependent oxidoreductase [Nocardioidaceae bacterium]
MQEFEGRTAVVTGAASGIGLALVEQFVDLGMRVVMADWHEKTLVTAAEDLAAQGADVLAVVTDVSDSASVDDLARRAFVAYGDVHILCNNAGVTRPGSTFEATLDDWKEVMAINFWGVLHGMRAFVPSMLEHGQDGHVVNTSSINGLVTTPQFASYIASKYAVTGATETLAAEIALIPGARLGVSLVCPAGVATNIFANEIDRWSTASIELVGDETMKRFHAYSDPTRTDKASPADIASAVVRAIKDGTFYVLPQAAGAATNGLRARMATITAALDGDESKAPKSIVQAPGMN